MIYMYFSRLRSCHWHSCLLRPDWDDPSRDRDPSPRGEDVPQMGSDAAKTCYKQYFCGEREPAKNYRFSLRADREVGLEKYGADTPDCRVYRGQPQVMRRHLAAIEHVSVVMGFGVGLCGRIDSSTDEEGEKLPVSEWRYSTPCRLFERLRASRGDKNDSSVCI